MADLATGRARRDRVPDRAGRVSGLAALPGHARRMASAFAELLTPPRIRPTMFSTDGYYGLVVVRGIAKSLPWELAEYRRRGHDRITGNDTSSAYSYSATGIAVDGTSRRAIREAPGKPDLSDYRLTSFQLATARRHVALLRHAAGLDRPTDHPADPDADDYAAARSRPWP